ncbi:MAG: translation initiation factor [Miltoncostaeaceae bacterium]
MPTGNTGNRGNSERVYSTDGGRVAESSAPAPTSAGGAGKVTVELSRSGRRGKTVTVVHGLPPGELRPLSKELKRLCGAGGSAKDGVVEIQGDHRDAVVAHLSDRFRVVRSRG